MGAMPLTWITNSITERLDMKRAIKRKPMHPGVLFKADVLDELGVSVSAAARALGVSRKHLSAFVNGNVSCSKDLAIRLAKSTDTSVASWLNMQTALDIYGAENDKKSLKGITPLANLTA